MGRQQESESYQGFREPGIRLVEPLLPDLQYHRMQNMHDKLGAVHRFDKAHLVMLTEQGLVSREDGSFMLEALREMEDAGVSVARGDVGGGMHSGEHYLIRRLGEDVGGRIHLGRSSGDLGEVSRRITMRGHIVKLLGLLNTLRRMLLDLSASHAETVMPGYTHGQHAQVTTYGHWLAMWASVMARDVARLLELLSRVNQSPAGGAAMAGTDFPLDQERTAELLGFSAPIPNAWDAIRSHDVDLECAAVLALHGSSMARLGEDILLFSSEEYGLLRIPDRFCGASSIMMQKRNPYGPQEMKALAAEALGGLVTAFMVEKDPTGLPVLERRQTERAMWSVFNSAALRLQEAADLVPGLEVHRERMLQLAGAHWAQATDVAGALVREAGLPWRSAHQVIGILVRRCEESHVEPLAVTSDMVDEAAIEYMDQKIGLDPAVLADSLDPTQFVRRRDGIGGPAPAALERDRQLLTTYLQADERAVADIVSRLERSERVLEAAIDNILETDR